MKKFFKKLLKILKWIGIILVILIIALLIVRFIGRKINSRTPDGGINETKYIDVNGQEQWISIYGEDKNNPVMLFLHGGPGTPTSYGDWIVLRKMAKDYTIVSWDQRNCGKTWIHDQQDTPLTAELLRSDILSVTNYVLEYMGKEKLTLFGYSWGTLYGCDFALEHPELVECVINGSQVVDEIESEKAQKQLFLEWSEGDPEYHELAEQFDPTFNMSDENNEIFYKIAQKYGNEGYIPNEKLSDGDVPLIPAVLFNPYYSLGDYFNLMRFYMSENGAGYYADYIYNGGCYQSFTLKDKTDYEMPIYILEGDQDYVAVHSVAKEYFDAINAPDKDFQYVEGGHTAPILHSEKLAEFVHEIAEKQK